MSAQNKRSTMTLYVSPNDIFCHKIKIALAEKDIIVDIIDVNKENKIKELYELNPYGKVPTLLTKDLIIYENDIIFEYLEERFPYPPLLFVFPLKRAHARMLSKKIDNEWIPIIISALNPKSNSKIQEDNKKVLLKILFSLTPILKRQPYLLGDHFSIIDCSLAAILYLLPQLNIRLPEKAVSLIKYTSRIFKRESFKKSIKG